MAVCRGWEVEYSQLREDIHRLKSELPTKDQLIDSFVFIATTQSKHISYMQSSSLINPNPGVAACLSLCGYPSLASFHPLRRWAAHLEILPARASGHSCEQELDQGPQVPSPPPLHWTVMRKHKNHQTIQRQIGSWTPAHRRIGMGGELLHHLLQLSLNASRP